MDILEAHPSDGPLLASFLLGTPVSSGTRFILDRSPDFYALLRLRGHSRTFCAREDGNLIGIATALWDERRDGGRTVRVGEFVDLRVAASARGGRAALRLLSAVLTALEDAEVHWLSAMIGDENQAARALVTGKAGLPRLEPLASYVSVHMVAFSVPQRDRVAIREATDADAEAVCAALDRIQRSQRLAPEKPLTWPDPAGRHRAWLAADTNGRTVGGLVLWDGHDIRRVRVLGYSGGDRLLRRLTQLLALARLASPLPPAGGALRMWASRAFWNDDGRPEVTRALVASSLRAATSSGVNIVQLNLLEEDPLVGHLTGYPRSTFRSTLFGAPRHTTGAEDSPRSPFFADLALV